LVVATVSDVRDVGASVSDGLFHRFVEIEILHTLDFGMSSRPTSDHIGRLVAARELATPTSLREAKEIA
jgi:hypothetical protein